MKAGQYIFGFAVLNVFLASQIVTAGTITPANFGPPFAVQPFVGLMVTSGMTEPFFADVSALAFPGPGIVNVIGNIQAIDAGGNAINSFMITGVTVMQGTSTMMPPLQAFSLSAPVTYTDTLNPLNQVTLVPAALNLAFVFNSNPSFQYSYTLATTGIPDGGFLLYDDVEGAQVPEPGLWLPTLLITVVMIGRRYMAHIE